MPGKLRDDAPEEHGSFLNWLAKRRENLDIRILMWGVGLINSITRGETSFYIGIRHAWLNPNFDQ